MAVIKCEYVYETSTSEFHNFHMNVITIISHALTKLSLIDLLMGKSNPLHRSIGHSLLTIISRQL